MIPYTTPLSPKTEAEKLIETMLQRSMELQRKETNLFSQRKGHITLLVGTSTAGKSSIIDRYKKMAPGAIEEGVDITVNRSMLAQIRKQFPLELSLLQKALGPNAADVDVCNTIFSPNASPRYKEGCIAEEIQKSEEAARTIQQKAIIVNEDIDTLLLEYVLNNSVRGKASIFDHIRVDAIFQQIMKIPVQLPLTFALVYCPFHTLSERMDQRNAKAVAEGKPHEMRRGTFPFFQFAKIFGPKQKEDDIVLETLHREIVIADCRKQFLSELENSKKEDPEAYRAYLGILQGEFHLTDEATLLQKEEERFVNNLLNNLGFTSESVQTVEITPRYNFHHILLDSRQSAEQSTRSLLETHLPHILS
jgi:hypothetical protein